MMKLSSRVITVLLRGYVVLAIGIATVLSPLSLSFIPILVLLWYLYNWRWPVNPVVSLLTEYFTFFAVTLFLTRPVGPYLSVPFSLPVLFLVTYSLENVARTRKYPATERSRYPTPVFITLISILAGVLAISLLLGSLSLLLACLAITVYLGVMVILVLRRMPLKPVEESRVDEHILAGDTGHLEIGLTSLTGIGGLLSMESPYQWLKVSPGVLSLREGNLKIILSFTPLLSGPSVIKLASVATDRWGLIQTRFELEPINLFVIPRARYAAWMANRYLSATKPGTIPLMSSITALKPTQCLRRGIEWYGSRLYQAGDSLKNIDWKHSLKFNELISKEYTEFYGQTSVILINLAVTDAEEADRLAYNIIVTAISLAHEGIPAAVSAYDQENVKMTTGLLRPRELILMSLRVAKEMVSYINPVKYLAPPDVSRLRANINRIGYGTSPGSKVLLELLQMEYRNLNNQAMSHPSTRALDDAFAKVDRQSNIVVISRHNHDAEALAFNTFRYKRKGNSVITI